LQSPSHLGPNVWRWIQLNSHEQALESHATLPVPPSSFPPATFRAKRYPSVRKQKRPTAVGRESEETRSGLCRRRRAYLLIGEQTI
jgi:hypothetical protein